jgi:adenylate kinase
MSELIRIDVVLAGPQCAGKGHMAQALGEQMGMNVISTGDIYRAEMASGSALGNLVKELLKDGGICPDKMTNDLMDRTLAEYVKSWEWSGRPEDCQMQPGEHGLTAIDGYPRSLNQLDHVMELCDVRLWIVMDASYSARFTAAEARGRWDDALFSLREETYRVLTEPMVDQILQFPNSVRFNTLEEIHTLDQAINFVDLWLQGNRWAASAALSPLPDYETTRLEDD